MAGFEEGGGWDAPTPPNFGNANLVAGSLTLVGPNGLYLPNLPGATSVPTPGGVVTGSVWPWGVGLGFHVSAAGAKVDGQTVSDGAMTVTQATLTSASGKFKASDVGKLIFVMGAGAAGAPLSTTVATFISSTQVTTTVAAGSTVTGATVNWATNDTVAVQAAVTAAINSGAGSTVILPSGNCGINATIVGSSLVSLVGSERPGSNIWCFGTAFTQNQAVGKAVAFAWSVNLTTGASTLPGHNRGGNIQNIFFTRVEDLNGTNAAYDLICINAGCNINIHDFEFRSFWSSVYGATGYIDQINVREGYFYTPHGSGWQVRIGGLGDGLMIDTLSFDEPAIAGGGAIYLDTCRGGQINAPIAGSIYLLHCDSVTIRNLHGESAVRGLHVTFDSCRGCKLADSNIFKQSTTDAQVQFLWTDANASGVGNPNILENVQFITLGNVNAWVADVHFHSKATVRVIECFRRYEWAISPGDTTRSITMGIMVEDESAALLPAFNQWSHAYSHDSLWEQGTIRTPVSREALPARAFNMGSAQTSSSPVWGAASATYFYTLELLSNSAKGPISSADSGETSVAVTNGGAGILLPLNGGLPRGIIIRFRRGTSSGVYTNYVDIPIFGGEYFYDNGTQMNGFAWLASPPTRVLAFQAAFEYTPAAFRGYWTQFPSVGTWATGDRFFNSGLGTTPLGWDCTAGGSPGTWTPVGFTAPVPTIGTVAAAVNPIKSITTPNDGFKHVFRISGTVTITTLGSGVINLEVTYTDDANVARTCIIPLCAEAGTFATAANTADAWKGSVTIVANPNTALAVLTAGTFTGCTYNCSAQIEQLL